MAATPRGVPDVPAAPSLSARLGEAVANTCSGRKGGNAATLEEVAAVREVLTEQARAAAEAVRGAAEDAAQAVWSAGQQARATAGAVYSSLRLATADPSSQESEQRKATEAWLLGLNPEAEACKEEGNRLYAARRFDDALAEYAKARRLDPGRATYVSNTAAALLSLGKRKEAISAYCEAAALDASFTRPRQRLTTLCCSGEALEEALTAAMALSAAQPSSGTRRDLVETLAVSLRARAEGGHLFERGRYEQAETLYTEALERLTLLVGTGGLPCAPGAPLLLGNRAAARMAQERFAEALADCAEALAMAPGEEELEKRREAAEKARARQSAFGIHAHARKGDGSEVQLL